MSVRSGLRAVVFEWAQNQCEHPIVVEPLYKIPVRGPTASEWPGAKLGKCRRSAVELAHIWPRGMGHTGYRDNIRNVIAACTLHARSTDDLSSPEWMHVPAPHDRLALQEWVKVQRVADGWPLDMEEDL